MTAELLKGEGCKWCGRDLSQSFLSEVAGGIEKEGSTLFPILCLCGGITVIGAGTFVSYFDEVSGPDGRKVVNNRRETRKRGTRLMEAQNHNSWEELTWRLKIKAIAATEAATTKISIGGLPGKITRW